MNETNFSHTDELDGVAVLALSGYVIVIRNDEQAVFDSLLGTEL